MTEPQNQKLAEVLEKLEEATRKSKEPLFRRLVQNFFLGMSSSLGALVAIVLVVPLAVFLLKQIDWIPLVGEFFARIVMHMEAIKR